MEQLKTFRKIVQHINKEEFSEAINLQRQLLRASTKGTNILYRFRPANNYTIEEINTGKMHCSHPRKFNDSFDSNFGQGINNFIIALFTAMISGKISVDDTVKSKSIQISTMQAIRNAINSLVSTKTNIDDSEWLFSYLENYAKQLDDADVINEINTFRTLMQDAHTNINDKINDTFLVSCLTTVDYFNQLMWSHYADKEQGICIAYDFSNEKYFQDHASILPIIYSTKRPQIPWKDCILHSDNPKTIYANILEGLITKSKAWDDEQEWRVIMPKTDDQKFEMPPIKCIYLGTKIEDAYKKEVIKHAKAKSIPVKQMKIDSTTYDLHAVHFDI